MRYLIVLGLLALSCSAFADATATDTAAVNLTVDKYVYAAWAGNVAEGVSDWNHALYGADPANDEKRAFNLEVDPAVGSTDYDTVNVAWISNCAANIEFTWNEGNLPGTWEMKWDGPLCPAVTPPGGTYATEGADVNAKIVAPVTLTVSGIDYTVGAGDYAGSLTFTAWGL